MGTSASSNGPGSGVSLDPPWLDDIDESTSNLPGITQSEVDGKKNTTPDEVQKDVVIAPKGRFSSARRNLGEYVRSGSQDSLRRSSEEPQLRLLRSFQPRCQGSLLPMC